jgi:hypothetical protein
MCTVCPLFMLYEVLKLVEVAGTVAVGAPTGVSGITLVLKKSSTKSTASAPVRGAL